MILWEFVWILVRLAVTWREESWFGVASFTLVVMVPPLIALRRQWTEFREGMVTRRRQAGKDPHLLFWWVVLVFLLLATFRAGI
ncbi:hypothetical protein ACH4UV_33010 [Streptomyces sp. NPDC020802]|uniref:hypothetical protein n=1 Tax=Streptomyces sp. NPDC020802 TaxID=3365094 RepID=UPI00378E144D